MSRARVHFGVVGAVAMQLGGFGMPARANGEPVPSTQPPSAVATEPPQVATGGAERNWLDGVSIRGFASVGYSYNLNRPMSDESSLRVFDGRHNTVGVDVIELALLRPVERRGDTGFRIDLEAGSSVPRASASAGLFRDEDGASQDFDLQQALVSFQAANRLRVDVGKFVTPIGAEVIEGFDGWNDHYSHSILFGYAIPFTHTGLRVAFEPNEQMGASAMVVNGWDNVRDNNRGKSVGLSAWLAPVAALHLAVNYMGGPERDDSRDRRHLVDLVATYAPVRALTFGLNADVGREAGVAAESSAAMWMGAALYARWTATDHFALAARGELFSDRDGARTGTTQTVRAATVSPLLQLAERLVVRGDVRVDRSTQPIFATESSMSQVQTTLSVNVVAVL